MNYADSRRTTAQGQSLPRNFKAVARALERGDPLVVSFAGDTPWPMPTVYCDGGKRYDWAFIANVREVVVVAKPGIDVLQALRQISAVRDVFRHGYPWLIDIEAGEVAHFCESASPSGVSLMQVRRGTEPWLRFFE